MPRRLLLTDLRAQSRASDRSIMRPPICSRAAPRFRIHRQCRKLWPRRCRRHRQMRRPTASNQVVTSRRRRRRHRMRRKLTTWKMRRNRMATHRRHRRLIHRRHRQGRLHVSHQSARQPPCAARRRSHQRPQRRLVPQRRPVPQRRLVPQRCPPITTTLTASQSLLPSARARCVATRPHRSLHAAPAMLMHPRAPRRPKVRSASASSPRTLLPSQQPSRLPTEPPPPPPLLLLLPAGVGSRRQSFHTIWHRRRRPASKASTLTRASRAKSTRTRRVTTTR